VRFSESRVACYRLNHPFCGRRFLGHVPQGESILVTRMIAEQERACDEEVLTLGHDPEAYAQVFSKSAPPTSRRFCREFPASAGPT
jgi:hypothetical protein